MSAAHVRAAHLVWDSWTSARVKGSRCGSVGISGEMVAAVGDAVAVAGHGLLVVQSLNLAGGEAAKHPLHPHSPQPGQPASRLSRAGPGSARAAAIAPGASHGGRTAKGSPATAW